jgi:hypothetical protein
VINLSLTGKRTVAGIGLAVLLFGVANYYWFRLFEPYDKKGTVVCSVIAAVCILFFGPSVAELREYQEKKRTAGE